jgi:superoxide dismutase
MGLNSPPSRRTFLAAAVPATILATALGAVSGDEPAPKEAGLSFEGLLKGLPGFQPRAPAPQRALSVAGFLSQKQFARSYGAYREAFSHLLAVERALASASREPTNSSEYTRLRSEQIRAGNSVLLHEFYFRNLSTKRSAPSRYILPNMTEHMGSLVAWRDDFAACARVAGVWAVLVYDPYDDRWHNTAVGETDAGGWVGANPLVVLKVSPSAYSLDYRDRDAYIAAFLDHLDWDEVAARYRAVDRH